MNATFVIIGGGIAGVTCAETLAFYQPDRKIILISESSLIKTVTNLLALTQTLTTFNVEESPLDFLSSKYSNINVIHGKVKKLDDVKNQVVIREDIHIEYEYLCICIGAQPKLIPQAKDNPYILGIRDTDSVEQFLKKLTTAKRVAVVGNGGIASELIYKIQNTNIDWIIKDNHISATFVDPGAGEFFQSSLYKSFNPTSEPSIPKKRMRYEEELDVKAGAALGPDWYKHFDIKGACDLPPQVKIHYQTEISDIKINPDNEFPVEILLNNDETIQCDFVISATGVEPLLNFEICSELHLSNSNEILVDEYMRTSIQHVYAAGDVCHANWEHAKHWFPMKLWTQARQMGCYAAKCISSALNGEEILQDFCFEIFTHTTRLFGYKVILLGLYNGQKLGKEYEILFRMTKEHEYVKLVLQDGKLQGAVLIGDTDLEEMCENLILNQLDLSPYKEDLLDPNIDVEDYFD